MVEIVEVFISEIKDYLERERGLGFVINGRYLIPEFRNWRTDYNAFILMGENAEHIPGVDVLFLKGSSPSGYKPFPFIPVDLANPDIDPDNVVRDLAKYIIKFYCGPWTESEMKRGRYESFRY